MKVLDDPGQMEEVKKLMKQKPIIIFFFMNGCSRCEATRPAWKELTQMSLPFQFAEVESAAVPLDIGVRGFPHFHMVDKKGKVKKVDGEKLSVKDLTASLGLKSGGSRRRNTRRLVRRVRKTRHRSYR